MNDETNTKDKQYFRLFFKDRLFTVLVFQVLPLILVSCIILYQFQVSYYEKIYAHLDTLVKKHKLNIDSFLNEKLSDIRFMAGSNSFEDLSYIPHLEERLRLLQKLYGPVFVDLGVIDSKGVQVAYSGPFKLGEAVYVEADWFEQAMNSDFVISDVFLGLRGLPHFIVTVREYTNGKPWILRATIDFAAFNDLVENIRIGETGVAFILNREFQFQTKPMLEVKINKSVYEELLERGGKEEIHLKNDGDFIYVSALLKNGDWLLVYQQYKSDAFSDFYRALKIALIIIMLGIIATITLAFIRFKNMFLQMERSDQEKKIMDEQIIETGKLAAVGELAAGIAHEINNPVAIMVEEAGWIEDLLEEEEFGSSKNLEEYKRALRQINTQGKRCKEITHKLLSFARKTETLSQDTQLNDLISEVVALSSQRAKYSNVVMNTHLDQELPLIHVSQSEMQQVLLNLINNALDEMEKTGGNIDISTRQDSENIIIEVEDNGPGIPSAVINRIFDPFFTTKPVGKGTGLGLSICYGIINKMGGEINVESVLKKGTVFIIKFPFAKKEEKQSTDQTRRMSFD